MVVDTTDINLICNLCRNFLFFTFLTRSTLGEEGTNRWHKYRCLFTIS